MANQAVTRMFYTLEQTTILTNDRALTRLIFKLYLDGKLEFKSINTEDSFTRFNIVCDADTKKMLDGQTDPNNVNNWIEV